MSREGGRERDRQKWKQRDKEGQRQSFYFKDTAMTPYFKSAALALVLILPHTACVTLV